MSYYFAAIVELPFDAAIERTKAALQAEGFGVLSDIDVSATLKNKIGAEFRPYRILGACSPTHAYEALKKEDKVGTMLPCNVIVQELAPGRTEIAAIDPVASMQAIENAELGEVAQEVRAKLASVIEALKRG